MFKLMYLLLLVLSKSDEFFLENNETAHVKHVSRMKTVHFIYKIPNVSNTHNRILYDRF